MRFKIFFFMAWMGGMFAVPLYLINKTDLLKDLIFPEAQVPTPSASSGESPFGPSGEYGETDEAGENPESYGDSEFYGAEYVDREYYGDESEEGGEKPPARKAAAVADEADQIKIDSLLDAYKPDNLRAMMKQIEAAKKNMRQHQKMLDDLMKDDPTVQKPQEH